MHIDRFTRFSGSAIAMIVLIVALTSTGSLVFACAAPFAAVAAFAAITMGRKTGLALVGAVWLANQIIGFAVLGYPQTVDTIAWGPAMGLAAVAAFLVAHALAARLEDRSLALMLPATFIASFVAYHIALFATGYPLEGSEATLATDVVARVFEIDLVAFAGFSLLYWIWAHFIRPARPAAKHA